MTNNKIKLYRLINDLIKFNSDNQLPDLFGSDQQILWATLARAKQLKKKAWLKPTPLMNQIKNITDTNFWIKTKKSNTDVLLLSATRQTITLMVDDYELPIQFSPVQYQQFKNLLSSQSPKEWTAKGLDSMPDWFKTNIQFMVERDIDIKFQTNTPTKMIFFLQNLPNDPFEISYETASDLMKSINQSLDSAIESIEKSLITTGEDIIIKPGYMLSIRKT